MQMSGAQMVCEAIIAEGVTTVFGYPGGAIMHVYDEIYKQDGFEHILIVMNRLLYMLQMDTQEQQVMLV